MEQDGERISADIEPELTGKVIGAAIEVHRALGPGLVKAVDDLSRVHEAQLMTYLRLSGYRVGLLMNFNVKILKDGIKRRVL